MGVIAEQMEALASNILAASRERSTAIAQVRETTASILADARASLDRICRSRRELSESLERELGDAMSRLGAQVAELLGEFDQARAQRTDELNSLLKDQGGERSRQIAALLDDLGRSRVEFAAQLAEGLGAFADRVHAGTSQFLDEARLSRGETSQAAQERVFQALSGLRGRVRALAEQADDFLQRCRQTHGDMARQLHESLSLGTEARREAVGALLEGFRATQQQLADDLRAAGRRWQEFARARGGVARPPEPSPAEEEPQATAPMPKSQTRSCTSKGKRAPSVRKGKSAKKQTMSKPDAAD